MPMLHGSLVRPLSSPLRLLLRVHSSAGIPLASVIVEVSAGDGSFQTPPLAVLAMEGYAHLAPAARRAVEQRVWSRRAYVSVACT